MTKPPLPLTELLQAGRREFPARRRRGCTATPGGTRGQGLSRGSAAASARRSAEPGALALRIFTSSPVRRTSSRPPGSPEAPPHRCIPETTRSDRGYSLLALLGLGGRRRVSNRDKLRDMIGDAQRGGSGRAEADRPEQQVAGGLLDEIGQLFGSGEFRTELVGGLGLCGDGPLAPADDGPPCNRPRAPRARPPRRRGAGARP